jgi:hypothetical protein
MALRGLTLCPNGAALVYYGSPLHRDPRVYLEDILRKLCRELTPSLTMRPYLQVSRTWGQGGENIVGRYGSADALEFKLPNRFDSDGISDRHQDSWTN